MKLGLSLFVFIHLFSSLSFSDEKLDADLNNLVNNWTKFRELISKPNSGQGESEYEQKVRLRLQEISKDTYEQLLKSQKSSESNKRSALRAAQSLSPLINIWNDEWTRAIQLRDMQSQVIKSGDQDLSVELAKNLNNSIQIREHQLKAIEFNQNYQDVYSKVKKQADKLNALKNETLNQAKMIEELKKQLDLAKKQALAQAKIAAEAEAKNKAQQEKLHKQNQQKKAKPATPKKAPAKKPVAKSPNKKPTQPKKKAVTPVKKEAAPIKKAATPAKK